MRAAARAVVLATLALGACTPAQVHTRRAPADALAATEKRLAERDITLDPAGRRPDRLRTAHFCYQLPGREGRVWERSFAHPATGPVPFSQVGTPEEQDAAREKCPHLFRVEILARPAEDEGSEVTVQSEWWRVSSGACEPNGQPLMGRFRCQYRYVGSQAPDNVERYVYGILAGL